MNTQEIKISNAQTITINAKMQDKLVYPSSEQQVVLPDENYDGLTQVTVEAISLDNQIITPTKKLQTITPKLPFVGFSQVSVEAIPDEYIIPEGNLDITSNGDYDIKNNETVNVNVQPNLQDKSVNVKPNEVINLAPDESYDGLSSVNITGIIELEQKEVTPSKEIQTIVPSEGKYIDSVTVKAIPENYIEPTGELEITENGNYDVTDKESVNVVVPTGGDLSGYFKTDSLTNSNANGWSGVGSWFNMINKLPSFDFNGTDCGYLFSRCQATEIPLDNFDTSNVLEMDYMFMNCSNLTSLDLSKFITSKVTNMNNMFYGCSSLENLDLSDLVTDNLQTMNSMFASCNKLKSLILSNFNTSNVTDMYQLFRYDNNLTSLDLSNFDLSKVTRISYAFGNCSQLNNLVFGSNLGAGYTATSENYSYCELNFSSCPLTYESIMDVINKLYDLASNGKLSQRLVLGNSNLAKISDEEKAIATNKGWNLS